MAKAKAVTGVKASATPAVVAVKVSRINVLKDPKNTLAFFDICLYDSFVVQGLRVVKGEKSLFVSMPQQKGKDGKYYDRAHPITREIRNTIEDLGLAAYAEATKVVAVPVAA
jgi:stage V sporulation protein G